MKTNKFYVNMRQAMQDQREPIEPAYRTGVEHFFNPQTGNTTTTRHRGWDRIPGFNKRPGVSNLPDNISWILESYKIENWKYGLGTPDDPNQAPDNVSFAYVRPGGVNLVSMWRHDEQGMRHLLSRDEALQYLNLGVPDDKQGAKQMKRISRYLRPSYAFNVFENEQFGVHSFEGRDEDWDAMMLMTRSMFDRVLAGMDDEELKKSYQKQGRFEISMQGQQGQWKGHVRLVNDIRDVFPDAAPGAQMAIQKGSWKTETRGDYPDRNSLFVDVRPEKFHTGVDMDVQTWTNIGRYVLPNQTYQEWTRQKNDDFIAKIQRGLSHQEAFNLAFGGVDSEEQAKSRFGMPLYNYIASGGDIRNSPHMMREFGDMYLQTLQKKFGGQRLAVPDSFSGYMVSAATYPEENRSRLKPGYVALDPRNASIVYHPDDTKDALWHAGGADYDDRQAGFVYVGKDEDGNPIHKVLLWRSPNEPGEYQIMKLQNPHVLEKLGIKPVEGVDEKGLERVIQLQDKHYGITGDQIQAPDRSHLKGKPWAFLRDIAGRIDPFALGAWLTTLRTANGIFGRGEKDLPFNLEYATDLLQKHMEPADDIKAETMKLGGQLARYPMPYSYWQKIAPRVPSEQKRLGYIPMSPSQQVSNMDEFNRLEWERVSAAIQGMANIAAQPTAVTSLIDMSGGKTGNELKGEATGKYWGVLNDLAENRPGKRNDQWDYEVAGLALQEFLEELRGSNPDKFKGTMAQMLVNTGTTKYGEEILDDSFAWRRGKTFDLSKVTLQFLRDVGVLNAEPKFESDMQALPPAPPVNRALSLIVNPSKAGIDPHRLLGLDISLGEEVTPQNVRRQTVLANKTLDDGTPWQGVMGSTVSTQSGMLQGLQGTVMSAIQRGKQDAKHLILTLAQRGLKLAEPKASYSAVPGGDVSEEEAAILSDLRENARRYMAGQLDISQLSEKGRYAVELAASQMSNQAAPRRNQFQRMYYDTSQDARDKTPRVLGSRDMPWILELDRNNLRNQKKGTYSGRPELEREGIDTSLDAVIAGKRSAHTSYGEDARQLLFARPGDFALVYNKHSEDKAALVQIQATPTVKSLWEQQGLEWRGEAAYPLSGAQLKEHEDRWSQRSGWKPYFATFYHSLDAGIRTNQETGAREGNLGWQEELGLSENQRTADLSWNVNYSFDSAVYGKENVMRLLAGRIRAAAPPSSYFALPFTPQHLGAEDVDTYQEGNGTYYRPHRPADMSSAEYDARLTETARMAARGMINADAVNRRGWRGEFARWHFGGGRSNIDSFQAWHDQLDPQNMEAFERSYLGMYGEYLVHKSEGWSYNQLSNTVWAQYWNRFSQQYNLGGWPNTYMQKLFGMRWLDMHAGAGAPPPGTQRTAEPAAPYDAGGPPPPDGPPRGYYENYPYPPPGAGFTPPMPEPPAGFDPTEPSPGHEPEPEPQPEYPWRAVFGWRDPVADDHPFKAIFDRQAENKQRLVEVLQAGKNVGVFMPTGTGKTEFIKAMPATLGGVNILLTPLSSLNEQQARRLIDETTPKDRAGNPVGPNLHNAVYLPGDPGYGHDKTQYKAATAEAFRLLNAGFQKDERGEYITDERGKRIWSEPSTPLTLVMSPEKFVNLQNSAIGRALQGHVRSVTIDEAQEFAKHVGREQMARLPGAISWLKGDREKMSVLLTGGTVSAYQEMALKEAYGLDEVIREESNLPHINIRLNVTDSYRAEEYTSRAVDFVNRAEAAGGKALVYGYSTSIVEKIAEHINGRAKPRNLNQDGDRMFVFHKGKGQRGQLLDDEELKSVTQQFDRGQLDQHLASSSAGGMGIDLKDLRWVANVGPAEISDIVQRAGRIRPGEKGPDGRYGGTFELIANARQFEKWGQEINANTSTLSRGADIVADVFNHVRRIEEFSPGWKEESDEISKAMGKYLKERYGISENRGADVHSVLRQVGAISMHYEQMEDGQSHPIMRFEDIDNLTQHINDASYTNEYRPGEQLSYGQYWDVIGKRKSGDFFAVAKLMDRLTPLSRVNPEKAGRYFFEGLLSAYQARPAAEAPKQGHEGLAVKVMNGQGEEFRVYENIFTGPESGEISITTYADAFSKALRSGGSISGSWHSQPAGRSDRASDADRSGIGTLGDMEIQEGDNFVQRMRTEAPLTGEQMRGPEPAQPQPQPAQAAPPQQPLMTDAEKVNRYTDVTLNQRMLADALKELTEAAKASAEQVNKQADAAKRHNEEAAKQRDLRLQATGLANTYGISLGALGEGMMQAGQGMLAENPTAARILGFGGGAVAGAAEINFKEAQEVGGQEVLQAYRAGYTGGGSGGGGRGGGSSRMMRLSGVLSAMRAWRYIADPVLQEAYAGTTDYLDIAGASGAPESRGNTVSGFRTRAQIANEWSGRGAYEAFGGFLDLGYALSGSGDGVARASAGARVGFGLAASGSEMGFQMYQNAYFMPDKMPGKKEMMAIGQKMWQGSMQAGGILAGASIFQEVIQPFAPSLIGGMFGTNLGNVPQEGWASQFARGVVGGFADMATIAAIGRDGGVGFLPTIGAGIAAFMAETAGGIVPGLGPSMRKMVQQKTGLTREVYKKYGATDEWADYLSYGGDSENVKKYMENAKDLQRVLGGTADQHIGVIAQSVATLGITNDQSVTLLSNAGRLGISDAQWLNAIEGVGQQLGYRAGTAGMANFAMSMQGLDMAGLSAMQSQAGRVAQFAGSLAPYMGYEAAAGLVQRYGINSPAQVGAGQQVLGLADRYGIDTSAVTGQVGTGEFEKIKKTEKKLTGYQWVDEKGDAFDFLSDPNPIPATKDQAFDFLKKQEEPALNTRSKTGRWEPVYKDVTTEVNGAEIVRDKKYGEDLSAKAMAWQKQKGSAYVENVLGITGAFMDAGLDKSEYEPLFDSLSSYFSDLSPQQMGLATRALGGDMGAMSFASWHAPQLLNKIGFNVAGSTWFDMAGRPISQTSGALFRQLSAGQYAMGNPYGQAATPGLTGAEAARSFLSGGAGQNFSGVSSELLAAWDQGGTEGLGWTMFNKQWIWTQQSLNMQQQQLTGSIAYTRQMWGFEDQMNQLQYRSQMADFSSQRERMALTHSFDLQQESLTLERMAKGNEYNRWNLQFNQQTSLMQRGWAREDYQFQDTMRGLQFGWNMEDMNEAIRFSTGRERRKLIRQRDRAATTHNLEEDQVDTQRERQEQMWAREDERYKKLMQYTEDMIKLDLRSFELNKSQRDQLYAMDKENLERHIQEYQQQFDLQRQMEEAQRNYQEIQWDFQQRQLDLQKEQAQAQHDYELIMKSTAQIEEKIMGYWKQIAEYDPAKLMKPLVDMMTAAGALDKTKAEKIVQAITAIGSVDATRIQALINALEDAAS